MKASSESQSEQGGGSNPMMMGMGMMKKMMAQMKAGEGGKPPLEQMMGMCMGMCGEMLSTMQKTTAMAAFATPELHQMFGEWMTMLEAEALKALQHTGATDAAGLAKALSISEEGATYLIAHLAKSSKVSLRVEAGEGTVNDGTQGP